MQMSEQDKQELRQELRRDALTELGARVLEILRSRERYCQEWGEMRGLNDPRSTKADIQSIEAAARSLGLLGDEVRRG